MDNRVIVGSGVQEVTESSFISKVYLWMAFGLFLSAVGAFGLLSQPQIMKALVTNMWLMFGVIAVEIGLVVWLSARIQAMSVGLARILFCAYSLINGVTLASVLLVYTGASVLTTLAITAGTFFFFSLYGMTTKKDLTGIGGIAVMALIGVVIGSIVNIFLKSSAFMWVLTFIGIAVFLVLIAWDTQKLKALHANSLNDPSLRKKVAVIGALMLYLDFINLFLLLLRLFGKQRD